MLKILADNTRLRMIQLLGRDELSVAELQEILDMGQSRISSHLALLRRSNIVTDRKDGKRTYYSLNPDLPAHTRDLIHAACAVDIDQSVTKSDSENLDRILEKRRQAAEQYFNEVAGRLCSDYCPGRSWEAIGHFLLYLVPQIDIVDLGAGEGVLAQLLARRAKMVHCIDSSQRMVEIGTALAKQHGFDNLSYKKGDLEAVPLKDNSVDLALLSQSLHHAQHPEKALSEAYRILRPDGQIIIIDLKKHHFEEARERFADVWLGFTENALYQYLKKAGFSQIQVNCVSREKDEPKWETLIAYGAKSSKR